MEKVKKFTSTILSLLFVTAISAASVHAGDNKDKITIKARQAVEQASPEDWLTLAESAEICFEKKVNLREAAEWIDQSLSIKETSYNLEVKGDYYFASNLFRESLDYYVKSMKKGREEDPNFDSSEIQAKIVKVREASGI